jgi:hypothetical protein
MAGHYRATAVLPVTAMQVCYSKRPLKSGQCALIGTSIDCCTTRSEIHQKDSMHVPGGGCHYLSQVCHHVFFLQRGGTGMFPCHWFYFTLGTIMEHPCLISGDGCAWKVLTLIHVSLKKCRQCCHACCLVVIHRLSDHRLSQADCGFPWAGCLLPRKNDLKIALLSLSTCSVWSPFFVWCWASMLCLH